MLAQEKKKTNYLVSINNINDIEKYKKVGISTFLFALKDFSIGYEKSFTIDEINNIGEKKYVLINKLLDTKEIEKLKSIINTIKCEGFIFEDVGLINNIDDKYDKILFMNHFNTNSLTINTWLKYVNSVVLSSELTFDEYKEILSKVNESVVLNVFGYNQIMYSKRSLITNYNKHFNQDNTNNNVIKDQNSNLKFKILEDNNETIVLSDKIFNGSRLFDLDNVKYFMFNTSYIKIDDVIKFIETNNILNSDEGFLDKPSFYKLKGGVK